MLFIEARENSALIYEPNGIIEAAHENEIKTCCASALSR